MKALLKFKFKNQTGLKSADEVVNALNSNEVYSKVGDSDDRYKSLAVYMNPPASELLERNRLLIENLDCQRIIRDIQALLVDLL